MKLKVLAAALILMFGSAAAIEVPDSEGLQQLKEEYNGQSDNVPGFVSTIVGGEKVNFRIENESTNETVGVAFEGVEITKIEKGGLEDPTLEAWTDQETINTIIESDEKYSELQEALNENDIDYEAKTTESTIKVVIFDTLRGIADALGLSL